MSRSLLAVLVCLALAACNSPRSQVVSVAPAPEASRNWPVPVGDVPLLTVADREFVALEVGVLLFEPGIESGMDDAHQALRNVETQLFATELRDTLTATNSWGAVRVLPEISEVTAITIEGTIVHSDGSDLVLAVRARDVAGRLLLDATYHDVATSSDYPVQTQDPFVDIYRAIANDLLTRVSELGAPTLAQLPLIAELRYAQSLVPDAFSGFLTMESGVYQLRRLPADEDPMLARVERVRNQEYLFIDTVDEQFVDLREQIGPTYNLWRQSTLEQARYFAEYQGRAAGRQVTADRGSFAAMQQVYATYRSVKVQEQDLFDYALGFDNEVKATVVASGDRVVRLEGTLEQQYSEWRRLLADIFRLENAASP